MFIVRPQMSTADLVSRIKTAFAGVVRPDPSTIAPHRCSECDELRDALAPCTPDSVSIEVLRKHVWDLPLLSDEAKQYYLPAWLCASFTHNTWDFADAAIQDINSNHRYEPVGGYSDEQWSVLLEWLEHYASSDDPVTQENATKARERVAKRGEA
jgi:hypothetical protein